jgi:hypothetical protein
MQRRSWFALWLAVAFALLCGFWAWILGARVASGEHDFLSFYVGAKLAPQGNLYDLPAQFALHRETVGREYRGVPYIRFPYYAYLLQPLGWLPFRWAWPAWMAVQGLCAFWILWLFGRADREYLGIMILLPAVYTSVMGGQDTLLFTALLICVWMLLEKQRDEAAGALLAVALIKPHFAVVFALVLLVRRRWRAVAAFAVSTSILYLASTAISGLDWPVEWAQAIRPEVLMPKRHVMPNGMNLLETLGFSSRLAWLSLVAVAGVWSAWAWHRSIDLGKAFAIAAIAGILAAPHAYMQDLVILLPAFAWLGLAPRWQATRLALIPAVLFLPFLQQLGRPYSAILPAWLAAVLAVAGMTASREDPRSMKS